MAAKKGKSKKSVKKAVKEKVVKVEPTVIQNPPEAPVVPVDGTTEDGNVIGQITLDDAIADNPTAVNTPSDVSSTTEKGEPSVSTGMHEAVPRPTNQAWLTLQTGADNFRNAICLADIFNSSDIAPTKAAQGQAIWAILAKHQFYLHPRIETMYRNQQTCVFCGGQVIIRKTEIGSDAYCNDCRYLYSEE